MQAVLKSDLRKCYNVHRNTFNRYLKSVPGLNIPKANCYIQPSQLILIYKHLGEPYND